MPTTPLRLRPLPVAEDTQPATKPTYYAVECMPDGERALIARFGDHWKIFHTKPARRGGWVGHYHSAQAALRELED
jgi:hypothetical protein